MHTNVAKEMTAEKHRDMLAAADRYRVAADARSSTERTGRKPRTASISLRIKRVRRERTA